MQGNFIPKNLKLPEPKPAPKPLVVPRLNFCLRLQCLGSFPVQFSCALLVQTQAKASSKASSSGEHVQLFRMLYDRKKGFQAEH